MSDLSQINNAMPILGKYCSDILVKDNHIMAMSFRTGVTLNDVSADELDSLAKEFIFPNGENDVDVGYSCLYMLL